ncbi:hypothetical protein ACO2Q8_15410 [Larkinella sp. VNQ87]|uniref:hypothetical protein n=1 Tax=Larkinella sp. VNQ87 TaxID=3400921 RepID=UPI003C0FC149
MTGTTLLNAISCSQAGTLANPSWSRHVQESFDLYHELEILRDNVEQLENVQTIDERLGQLLFTLNTVFADLGKAPASSDQAALKNFMHQISRRLEAENRSVKELIRALTSAKPALVQPSN